MTYVVCQTPKCQQTYPIVDFSQDAKKVPCSKCGGTLIDENGRATFSQHPHVIPVITTEEIEQDRKDRLARKRRELARLQDEISEIEQEDEADTARKKPDPHHLYQCSGCGHQTTINKFYKTRRVFCGVCGEKTRMGYQGEYDVVKRPVPGGFARRPQNHS